MLREWLLIAEVRGQWKVSSRSFALLEDAYEETSVTNELLRLL